MRHTVWHYDGLTAIKHSAAMSRAPNGFTLHLEDGSTQTYDWQELVDNGMKGSDQLYRHQDKTGWQIGLSKASVSDFAANLPRRVTYGRWIDRIGLWPAAGAFVAVSAAVVFVVTQAPDWLAPLVPLSFERKLGDAMIGDFDGRICNGPGGQQALDTLVKRVEPKSSDLIVRVVNIDMVNAVALPGGNIFVFRGLLQEAKSPDELAGVLGHEIGHVRNRDVMQALLRQMGVSVLLGGANSNVSGSLNAVISSTYSRSAESKADTYAIKAMERSNVSPIATAGFFARLAEMEKSLGKAKAALGYLSSHPLSEVREKAFRSSAKANVNYTPVINAEQWRALVESCKNDPDVEEGDGDLF